MKLLLQELISKSVIKSLLSVQGLFKKMQELASSESTWLQSSTKLIDLIKEIHSRR